MVSSYTTNSRIVVECSLKPLPLKWRVRRFALALVRRVRFLA